MDFCKVPYSTYNKTKTKTYIKILRHASLQMGTGNIYRKSQACRWYIKGDINVKKNVIEKCVFSNFGQSSTAFSWSIPISNISVERVCNLLFNDI